MNAKIEWTLKKENVEKIISRLEKAGRKVDHHIAWILYRNLYENKPYEVDLLSTLCEYYTSTIWNHGAVS